MSQSLTVRCLDPEQQMPIEYLNTSVDDLYSQTEKYFDYTDKLGDITAKTLVIVGAQDWICPRGVFYGLFL
jgi:hypothetical protein